MQLRRFIRRHRRATTKPENRRWPRKGINELTQKALLVYDTRQEDMILQVKYQGPVNEFGWLIPVPSLPKVQEGSMKCF